MSSRRHIKKKGISKSTFTPPVNPFKSRGFGNGIQARNAQLPESNSLKPRPFASPNPGLSQPSDTRSVEEQMEGATQFGYNALEVPVHVPQTPPLPVQRKERGLGSWHQPSIQRVAPLRNRLNLWSKKQLPQQETQEQNQGSLELTPGVQPSEEGVRRKSNKLQFKLEQSPASDLPARDRLQLQQEPTSKANKEQDKIQQEDQQTDSIQNPRGDSTDHSHKSSQSIKEAPTVDNPTSSEAAENMPSSDVVTNEVTSENQQQNSQSTETGAQENAASSTPDTNGAGTDGGSDQVNSSATVATDQGNGGITTAKSGGAVITDSTNASQVSTASEVKSEFTTDTNDTSPEYAALIQELAAQHALMLTNAEQQKAQITNAAEQQKQTIQQKVETETVRIEGTYDQVIARIQGTAEAQRQSIYGGLEVERARLTSSLA